MNKPDRRRWTRDEQILAFSLYCKTPFNKISAAYNRDIKVLADLIGRSASAVALKMVNFASLDPGLRKRNISGMKNCSKSDRNIWDEFHGNWGELAWQSELILARFKNVDVTVSSELDFSEIPQGLERDIIVKSRVNQAFFRKCVLASYSNKCCITGLATPKLLVASHIVPWHVDQRNRLNPHNGLALSALHDKAFDLGLITISEDYRVIVSNKQYVKDDQFFCGAIMEFHGKYISLPTRFCPATEFLAFHREHVFEQL